MPYHRICDGKYLDKQVKIPLFPFGGSLASWAGFFASINPSLFAQSRQFDEFEEGVGPGGSGMGPFPADFFSMELASRFPVDPSGKVTVNIVLYMPKPWLNPPADNARVNGFRLRLPILEGRCLRNRTTGRLPV